MADGSFKDANDLSLEGKNIAEEFNSSSFAIVFEALSFECGKFIKKTTAYNLTRENKIQRRNLNAKLHPLSSIVFKALWALDRMSKSKISENPNSLVIESKQITLQIISCQNAEVLKLICEDLIFKTGTSDDFLISIAGFECGLQLIDFAKSQESPDSTTPTVILNTAKNLLTRFIEHSLQISLFQYFQLGKAYEALLYVQMRLEADDNNYVLMKNAVIAHQVNQIYEDNCDSILMVAISPDCDVYKFYDICRDSEDFKPRDHLAGSVEISVSELVSLRTFLLAESLTCVVHDDWKRLQPLRLAALNRFMQENVKAFAKAGDLISLRSPVILPDKIAMIGWLSRDSLVAFIGSNQGKFHRIDLKTLEEPRLIIQLLYSELGKSEMLNQKTLVEGTELPWKRLCDAIRRLLKLDETTLNSLPALNLRNLMAFEKILGECKFFDLVSDSESKTLRVNPFLSHFRYEGSVLPVDDTLLRWVLG